MCDWLDACNKLSCDVNETGIFNQWLHEETFALKNKNCTSDKWTKVELTASITANIIEFLKSKNLRCNTRKS